jgi:hypothetical protein
MSLVYVRRLQNRTDYFAIFLTAISGRPALEAFIWFIAYAIWHVVATTKPQMPVIPPNPRLAKVGIAAVEPIDEVDVHHGRGAGLRRICVWPTFGG